MSKRNRYVSTNNEHITISRGTVTVRRGEEGTLTTHTTSGEVSPVTVGGTLRILVRGSGKDLTFKVLKTPAMLRDETRKVFARTELNRLLSLSDGEAAVEMHRVKYAAILPQRKTKSKS